MSVAIQTDDLVTLFKKTVDRLGDRTLVSFMGRDTSFNQMDAMSERVAAAIQAQGISKGDKIALYCVNCDIFAAIYMGIIRAGATVVPINLLLTPREISFILNDAEVKGVFYHEAFAANVQACRDNSGFSWAVCVGESRAADTDLAFSAFVANQFPLQPPEFSVKEDVAAILYTSGTTGRPKGAMLTHYNLANNTASVKQAVQITEDDVLLVVLPMFHAFAATVGMLTPLLQGCRFLPVPKFEPELVANTVAEGGATIFLGVPSMYTVLMNANNDTVNKFQTLKYCVSGGAAMPKALMEAFEAKFGIKIYEGDGPTECSPVTCVNPIGGVTKPASVGLPIPNVNMAIYDADGNEVARNEIGEICVKAPSVMKGYYHLPEATEESFFGEWFRTGDLGMEDDDGYFYIVDRIKDMIITNGMNVYPRIVEEVLYKHTDIVEAAVVGEPDERHGENVVAYVVTREGAELDKPAVRAFCKENLGSYQVPRKVFFMDALPKNAAGKILKRELRKHGELERGVDSRVEV